MTAWKSGHVCDDGMKVVVVPLYKGKGSENDSKNYRRVQCS